MIDFNKLNELPNFKVFEADGETPYDGRFGDVSGITPDGMLVNEACYLPRGLFVIRFGTGEIYRW